MCVSFRPRAISRPTPPDSRSGFYFIFANIHPAHQQLASPRTPEATRPSDSLSLLTTRRGRRNCSRSGALIVSDVGLIAPDIKPVARGGGQACTACCFLTLIHALCTECHTARTHARTHTNMHALLHALTN